MVRQSIGERLQCKRLARNVKRHNDLDELFKRHRREEKQESNASDDDTSESGPSTKRRRMRSGSDDDPSESDPWTLRQRTKRRDEVSEDEGEQDTTDEEEENVTPVARVKRQAPQSKSQKSKSQSKSQKIHKRNRKFGLTKIAASEVFKAPNQATMESYAVQFPFIEVVVDDRPQNDKLDRRQDVVIDERVTRKALRLAALLKITFPRVANETYGEENDRPRVVGLMAGLASLLGEEKVIAMNSPVEYYVQRIRDGKIELIRTSPPGLGGRAKFEQSETSLEHGDHAAKKWKMDSVLSVRLEINGQTLWLPRALIEAKGDDATFHNLYQASAGGTKLLLKRLQQRQHISRLYLEIWGTQGYYYGILDIFGYVTIKNGRVTNKSFERYQKTVKGQLEHFGHNFPQDSFDRCPKTIQEMQQHYDNKAEEFYDKYHCELPSQHHLEDFPVGVVYFSTDPECLPTGKVEVPLERASRFVQSHVRILGANAMVMDSARLLKNIEDFETRAFTNGVESFFVENKPTVKLPVPIIKPRAEVQVEESTLASTSATAATEIHVAPDAWENPPSRNMVRLWTVEDVASLVKLAFGDDRSKAARDSKFDGELLLVITDTQCDEWLQSLGCNLLERAKFRKWWVAVKNETFA